jgi:hypothetical protein
MQGRCMADAEPTHCRCRADALPMQGRRMAEARGRGDDPPRLLSGWENFRPVPSLTCPCPPCHGFRCPSRNRTSQLPPRTVIAPFRSYTAPSSHSCGAVAPPASLGPAGYARRCRPDFSLARLRPDPPPARAPRPCARRPIPPSLHPSIPPSLHPFLPSAGPRPVKPYALRPFRPSALTSALTVAMRSRRGRPPSALNAAAVAVIRHGVRQPPRLAVYCWILPPRP